MNLLSGDPALGPTVARDLVDSGMAVLREVELPASFRPSTTDVVLLRLDNNIEMYVGANCRYIGSSPVWRASQQLPVLGGDARLVASFPDVPEGAVSRVRQLLLEAGGVDGTVSESRSAPESSSRSRALTTLDPTSKSIAARPREVRAVLGSLLRHSKCGSVLIGPAGSGKTTIAQLVATELASASAPKALRGSTIWALSLGTVLEDVRHVGDLERQLRGVLESTSGHVLFVDEIHQLARTELGSLMDLLKPGLADGSIKLFGATTPTEWRRVEDRAFRRRFVEVRIPEPSLAEALRMVTARVPDLERHHDLSIPESIVRNALVLAHEHVHDRVFPDKGIDLLDEAAAIQTLNHGRVSDASREVEDSTLLEAAMDQSGLGAELLDLKRLRMEATRCVEALSFVDPAAAVTFGDALELRFEARESARRAAVESLVDAADSRPLLSVLDLRDRGGSQEGLPRALAKALYRDRLVRLNAAEAGTASEHGVAVWVGAPPGYVGHNQGGTLTDALRAHRACVIEITNIDRCALSALHSVILPLLQDGLVTDRNNGDELSARDSVVFLSVSNGNGLKHGVATEDVVTRVDAVLRQSPLPHQDA